MPPSDSIPRIVSEWASRWVLVLSVVGYPVVAAISLHVDVPNRTLTIPFRALVLLLAGVAILIFSARREKHPIRPFWLVWWLFWAVYVVRMVLDYFFDPSSLKIPIEEYLFYAVGVSMVPALALAFRRNRAVAPSSLQSMIVVGTIGLVLNFWIIVQQADSVNLLTLAALRLQTDTLNPISLGHLGVSVMVLCLWKLLTDRGTGVLASAALGICCILGVVGLVASASRGPALALAIVLCAMTVAIGARAFALLFMSVLVIGAAIARASFDLESMFIFERLATSAFLDAERSLLLSQAIHLIAANPLAGAGTEPLETYPHNILLESFLVVGIVSGLCFVFLLVKASIDALVILRVDRDRFWISLLFIQYSAGAMVSGSLYFSNIFWVLMAAVVSQTSELWPTSGIALRPLNGSRNA
jgi:hypothetical protein